MKVKVTFFLNKIVTQHLVSATKTCLTPQVSQKETDMTRFGGTGPHYGTEPHYQQCYIHVYTKPCECIGIIHRTL